VTIVNGQQVMQLDSYAGLPGQQGGKSEISASHALASTIVAAKDVSIGAGRDLTVVGSTVIAGVTDAKAQAAVETAARPIDYQTYDPARGVVGLGQGDSRYQFQGNATSLPNGQRREPGDVQAGAQGVATSSTSPLRSSSTPVSPPAGGTITLTAGRDLLLAASTDAVSADSKLEHGNGNFQSWENSATSINGTTLSGATVTLKAQGDITSIASNVNADSLSITTPGTLNLLTATANQNSNRDSKDHDAWFIDGGSVGSKHQTTVYNQFNANTVSISAGSINAQVSSRTSPQELAQQPGMAWMNQLVNAPALSGKVNWQRVQEVHDQWDNTIAGRRAVVLSANNIANLGGRFTGQTVDAKAKNDLLVIGGTIDADRSVSLSAGRDIRIETTTRTSTTINSVAIGSVPSALGPIAVALGSGVQSDTVIDRVAGVYVGRNGGSGRKLEMTSGRDTTLVAADNAITSRLGPPAYAGAQTPPTAAAPVTRPAPPRGRSTTARECPRWQSA
jgi:hypothetical protein